MIKKAIKTITLSAAMITMMSVFGHTTKVDAANITGTVTATSLNVRSGASTSYSIVGKVTKGKEVEILSSSNGWYKIKCSDITGWVSSLCLYRRWNNSNRNSSKVWYNCCRSKCYTLWNESLYKRIR